MKLVCKNYKVKDYLTLIALGDVHYGSRECDVDVFKSHIEMIKATKNCAGFLFGKKHQSRPNPMVVGCKAVSEN